MTKKLLIFCPFALSCFLFSGLALAAQLSLEQVLELAKSHSDKISKTDPSFNQNQLDADVAKASYSTDINVSFSGSYTEGAADLYQNAQDDNSTTSTDKLANAIQSDANISRDAYTVSIEFIFPWLYKNKYLYDEKIKRLGASIDQQQVKSSLRRLDVDIYIAYFDVILQRSRLRSQQALADVAEQRVKDGRRSLDLGRTSIQQLLDDERDYLQRESLVKNSEFVLFEKLNVLSDLVGVSVTNADSLSQSLQLKKIDPIHFQLAADVDHEKNSRIKAIEKKRQQAMLEIEKIEKSLWQPRLSLRVTHAQDNQDQLASFNDGFQNFPDAYGQNGRYNIVSATVTMPLPSAELYRAEKMAAYQRDIDLEQEEIQQREDYQRSITRRQEVLRMLLPQISTFQQLMEKNDDYVDLTRHGFSIGKTTRLELQNAESLQILAAENYYTVLFNIRKNYAELCWLLSAPLNLEF